MLLASDWGDDTSTEPGSFRHLANADRLPGQHRERSLKPDSTDTNEGDGRMETCRC